MSPKYRMGNVRTLFFILYVLDTGFERSLPQIK